MNGPQPDAGDFSVTPGETVPVPAGTRDVLPEEMAELRAISEAVAEVFSGAGYGEVATPALEFEDTVRLAAPDLLGGVYRLPDGDGRGLVLRFDSTIPIARLAATRYRETPPPLRFFYRQHAYRPVRPKRAESRQFLQIGMELLGEPAPAGDAEAIGLLARVLEAAGLSDFRIAVGDARFYTDQLATAGLAPDSPPAGAVLAELETRDLVGLRRELSAADISAPDRARLGELAGARGGRELLEKENASALLALDDLLRAGGAAGRVVYDLGLARRLSYYTGTILEVYAAGSGVALGGGGRYDELVGRFGREMTAFGFAVNMELLHLAVLAEQERDA